MANVAKGEEWDAFDARSTRGKQLLAWIPFGLLALLLFELTADPALAAVAACFKLGGSDLLTALWVRRVDSNKPRGRATAWFLVAMGFLKVGAAALFVVFLAMMITVWFQPQPAGNAPPRSVVACLLLVLSCYVLTLLFSWVAIASAYWNHVRVWADTRASLARKRNAWPPFPVYSRRGAKNGAGVIFLFGVMVPTTLVTFVAPFIFLSPMAGPRWVGPNAERVARIFVLGVFSCWVASIVVIAFLTRRLSRVIARHPADAYAGEVVAGWAIPPRSDGASGTEAE